MFHQWILVLDEIHILSLILIGQSRHPNFWQLILQISTCFNWHISTIQTLIKHATIVTLVALGVGDAWHMGSVEVQVSLLWAATVLITLFSLASVDLLNLFSYRLLNSRCCVDCHLEVVCVHWVVHFVDLRSAVELWVALGLNTYILDFSGLSEIGVQVPNHANVVVEADIFCFDPRLWPVNADVIVLTQYIVNTG